MVFMQDLHSNSLTNHLTSDLENYQLCNQHSITYNIANHILLVEGIQIPLHEFMQYQQINLLPVWEDEVLQQHRGEAVPGQN